MTFCVHPEEIDAFYERRGFEVVDLVSGEDLVERYGAKRAFVDPSVYAVVAKRA